MTQLLYKFFRSVLPPMNCAEMQALEAPAELLRQ